MTEVAGNNREIHVSNLPRYLAPFHAKLHPHFFTDVLVVGMGGSGTYAAMRAVETGANVLAIEKMARYGGTTGLTSEVFAINDIPG